MKRIIKTDLDDKPYKLLFNPIIKDFIFDNKFSYRDTDFDDILITQGQKNLLSCRSRCHWLTTFLNKGLVPLLLDYMSINHGLEHYAYCVHDCDTWSENSFGYAIGSPKDIHVHLLLCFNAPLTLSVTASLFHTESVTPINSYNLSKQYNYLIHDSDKCRNEKKYQYSSTDRISDDLEYFKNRCVDNSTDDKAINCVNDVLRGISTRDLVRKYGCFAIMQYKNILTVVERIKEEEKNNNIKNNHKNSICIIDSDGVLSVIRNMDLMECDLYAKNSFDIKFTKRNEKLYK